MRTSIIWTGLLVTITAAKLIDDGFDELVEAWLELLHVPGMSMGIVRNGEVDVKGYGWSQLGPDVPATPDTLYFTGSTTKAFTAAAAARIVTNSSTQVKWATPMSQLLPADFVLSDEYATSHITLEDALSHRSGLPRHDGSYGWGNATATDIVRSLRYLDFSAEPRVRWQYCNTMFAAVGLWVEKFTATNLEQTLREWFWKPLGMRSTTFSIADAAKQQDKAGSSRLARGYYWTGEHYVPETYLDLIPVAGAGATISSVNDYLLWAQTILAAANDLNSSSPINNELYRTLTTPRSIVELNLPPSLHLLDIPTYALGWIVDKVGTRTVISHSGGLAGFGTDLFIVPELDLAFVSMGNTAITSNQVGAIAFLNVFRRVGGLSVVEADDAQANMHARIGTTMMGPGASLQQTAANETDTATSSPLPGKTADYLGLYSHPAYGIFNVTLPPQQFANLYHDNARQRPLVHREEPLTLHIIPSKRIWPGMYALTHSHDTFFDAGYLLVHGDEDLPSCASNPNKTKGERDLNCKNEVAHQLAESGRAVFELGIQGGVERLGIEAESELVRLAEEEGEWRRGMIWFDKITT